MPSTWPYNTPIHTRPLKSGILWLCQTIAAVGLAGHGSCTRLCLAMGNHVRLSGYAKPSSRAPTAAFNLIGIATGTLFMHRRSRGKRQR
jgi:hypothetical protein